MNAEQDVFEFDVDTDVNFDAFVGETNREVPEIVEILDNMTGEVDLDWASGHKFIVIAEIKPELYHIFLNEMFRVEGGRRITRFPETLHGARKLAQQILDKSAIRETVKVERENGTVEIVETGKILGYRLEIVETHNPTLLAPHHRDLIPDEIEIPEFDDELTHRSKIFRLYLAAHKQKWDINRLARATAVSLNKRYNGTFARKFHEFMRRLADAVAANKTMQKILMNWHGKPTLPDLGTIQIPARKLKEYVGAKTLREYSQQSFNSFANIVKNNGGENYVAPQVEKFDRENNPEYQKLMAKKKVIAGPAEMSITVADVRKGETFVLGGDLWTMGETIFTSDDDGVCPTQYWAIPETGDKHTTTRQAFELSADKTVLVVR